VDEAASRACRHDRLDSPIALNLELRRCAVEVNGCRHRQTLALNPDLVAHAATARLDPRNHRRLSDSGSRVIGERARTARAGLEGDHSACDEHRKGREESNVAAPVHG